MTSPLANSFASELRRFEEYMAEHWSWPSPDIGFAGFLFETIDETIPAGLVAGVTWPSGGRLDHAPLLASAGYLLASGKGDCFEKYAGEWAEAIDRLAARKVFTPDHLTFAYRAGEVLGITLGVAKCKPVKAATCEWLRDVISQAIKQGAQDPWSQMLYGLAGVILGVSNVRPQPHDLGKLRHDELSLAKWLAVAYADALPRFETTIPELDEAILRRFSVDEPSLPDIGRVATMHWSLRSAVLRRIESSLTETALLDRTTHDALAVVTRLCRRFPSIVRQLQSRHDSRSGFAVDDEYDVQDLLHALLRGHFDDIRPEECTPSYAGLKPRMDLLLKREQIIIETKMTRKSLRQRKLAEELIIDKEQYRTHPNCKSLVCFVYDPEHWCENPSELEKDLSSGGMPRVVVVVSPNYSQ